MNKETITIEIPVLDKQESFDLVNTFNEEQMKYVAVICKGYEKEVQKANKQKEVLDKIKKELEEPDIYGVDEDGYDDAYYDKIYVRRIEELLEEIK